ncbi:MAG: hypothetical protein R3Y24_15600 [Eubacteriales bacterium]
MQGAIVGGITSLIINVISTDIVEKKNEKLDERRVKMFEHEITIWIEEFSEKHDGTIITSGSFVGFLEHHHLLEALLAYVSDIESTTTEKEFIRNLICKYRGIELLESSILSPLDESMLMEFFTTILCKYKKFFEGYLSKGEKYIVSSVNKTFHESSKELKKEIEKSNTNSTELNDKLDEVKELLKGKQKLSVSQQDQIYYSISKLLWNGYITEITNFLPLIECRDNDLQIAMNLSLNLIVRDDVDILKEVVALETIENDSIKKDIIRKIIFLNADDIELFIYLEAITEESQLKNILKDLIARDYERIIQMESECKYGVEIRKNLVQSFYNQEEWLIRHIFFMYVYKINALGTYEEIKEVVHQDTSIIEKILLWNKAGQEIGLLSNQDKYVTDGKALLDDMDNYEIFCSKLNYKFRKKYYFTKVNCALMIEADDKTIISSITQDLKEDVDIKELILLSSIKHEKADKEDIFEFCLKNNRYLALYHYLLQWNKEVSKIIDILDDYKFIFKSSFLIFWLYVQCVRIEIGKEQALKILKQYNMYENYLEYMLEEYRILSDVSIIENIIIKQQQLILKVWDDNTRDFLLELLIEHNMNDAGIDTINGMECISAITPARLKCKSRFLLGQGKEIEALEVLIEIFEAFKESNYIMRNIIHISISHSREIPKHILEYAMMKSEDEEVIFGLALDYERTGNLEASRFHSLRALIRCEPSNIKLYYKYMDLTLKATNSETQNVNRSDVETTIIIVNKKLGKEIIYCIHNTDVLPTEPHFWENAIHIGKAHAISIGMFRKQKNDIVVINEIEYTITKIMPLDYFLVALCMRKLEEEGGIQKFQFVMKDGQIDNLDELITLIKSTQGNVDTVNNWLDDYAKLIHGVPTLYILHTNTRFPYLQFVCKMIEEKEVIVRNLFNNMRASHECGYIMSLSALIMLRKIGISADFLSENNVVIPASMSQCVKKDTEHIINANEREHVASLAVCNDSLIMDELTEDDKQYWMKEAVLINEYVQKLTCIENKNELNMKEVENVVLKDLYGISDYDAFILSNETKRKIIAFEPMVLQFCIVDEAMVGTIDIISFLIEVQCPIIDLIMFMKNMIEYRIQNNLSESVIFYIVKKYEELAEDERQIVLNHWYEYLKSVEATEESYKEYFYYSYARIMKENELDSQSSPILSSLLYCSFAGLGYFIEYGINEYGEFEINLGRETTGDDMMENIEEQETKEKVL